MISRGARRFAADLHRTRVSDVVGVDDEHLVRLALGNECFDRDDDRCRVGRDGNRAEHRFANPQRASCRRRLNADGNTPRRRVDGARDFDHATDAEWFTALRLSGGERRFRSRPHARRVATASRSARCRARSGRRSRRAVATDRPTLRAWRPRASRRREIGDSMIDRFAARRAISSRCAPAPVRRPPCCASLRGAIPSCARRCCRSFACCAASNAACAASSEARNGA